MKQIKRRSYVLKQGSPDMSCVVMTTCNRKKQKRHVSFRLNSNSICETVISCLACLH